MNTSYDPFAKGEIFELTAAQQEEILREAIIVAFDNYLQVMKARRLTDREIAGVNRDTSEWLNEFSR